MNRNIRYSNLRGDYVVDSLCTCGHLERDHGSKTVPLVGSKKLRDAHSGSCCCSDCGCRQFTYARDVTLEEFRANFPRKQEDRLKGALAVA